MIEPEARMLARIVELLFCASNRLPLWLPAPLTTKPMLAAAGDVTVTGSDRMRPRVALLVLWSVRFCPEPVPPMSVCPPLRPASKP